MDKHHLAAALGFNFSEVLFTDEGILDPGSWFVYVYCDDAVIMVPAVDGEHARMITENVIITADLKNLGPVQCRKSRFPHYAKASVYRNGNAQVFTDPDTVETKPVPPKGTLTLLAELINDVPQAANETKVIAPRQASEDEPIDVQSLASIVASKMQINVIRRFDGDFTSSFEIGPHGSLFQATLNLRRLYKQGESYSEQAYITSIEGKCFAVRFIGRMFYTKVQERIHGGYEKMRSSSVCVDIVRKYRMSGFGITRFINDSKDAKRHLEWWLQAQLTLDAFHLFGQQG